jgi:hypothetical protein
MKIKATSIISKQRIIKENMFDFHILFHNV